MIYTVTLNPALDYIMRFKTVKSGMVNRSESEKIFVGGKGINVSLVLKELGTESAAFGFVAGFSGKIIREELAESGIKTDFVELCNGYSRINVKIKGDAETDLNARGPEVSFEELDMLLEKISGISSGDTLILSGSVPDTLPDNIYEKILGRLEGKNIRIIADAEGKLLLNVLKYRPFLIKPNLFELGGLFGTTIGSVEEAVVYAAKLQQKGAKNVLVSMGETGAVLVDETGKVHKSGVAEAANVSAVGAGDSMIAGFLAGYIKTGDYEYALRLGSAAGNATAGCDRLAKRDDIMKMFEILSHQTQAPM